MKRLVPITGAVLTLTLAASAIAPALATNNHNPGGNNGFVKINNEVAPDSIPQNHPHVSCNFSIEFYNYDKNNTKANVSFELQAPTNSASNKLAVKSGNLAPFIGQDTAGGGNDLDAREQYTLGFSGTAHQNQGYHVKVTVNAPGSKGSDKKHKVFWVKPCASTTGTTKPPVSNPTPDKNTETTPQSEMPAELPRTGASFLAPLLAGGLAGAVAYPLNALRKRQ